MKKKTINTETKDEELIKDFSSLTAKEENNRKLLISLYPNVKEWNYNKFIAFKFYVARIILANLYGTKEFNKLNVSAFLKIDSYQTLMNLEKKGGVNSSIVIKVSNYYVNCGMPADFFIRPLLMNISIEEKPYINLPFNIYADILDKNKLQTVIITKNIFPITFDNMTFYFIIKPQQFI